MTDFERGHQDMLSEIAKAVLEHGADHHAVGIFCIGHAKRVCGDSRNSEQYKEGIRKGIEEFLTGDSSWMRVLASLFTKKEFKKTMDSWELSS